MGQAITRYHISLDVADRPGVLAQVATAFAEHDVSIETVRQQVPASGDAMVRPQRPGPTSSSSPTPRPMRRCRRPSTPSLPSPSCAGSIPSCVWKVSDMAHQWRGVIREYADRLPMLAGAPTVTLLEGGTPLIPASIPLGAGGRAGVASSSRGSTRPGRSRTAG
jgi:hypothetical protein